MSLGKDPQSSAQIIKFLKSFEGSASTFNDSDGTWALWIPEITAGEHPVTPGSQVFFAVIMRHGVQLIPIRFFYDCRTGGVKFYTGAIPDDLWKQPEFENAVSELFRHSLSVEPIKQRQLRRSILPPDHSRSFQKPTKNKKDPTPTGNVIESQDPIPSTIVSRPALLEEPSPGPVISEIVPVALAAPALPPTPAPIRPDVVREERTLRVEICDSTRRVLQILILVFGIVGISLIAAFVYLQVSEDPGVKHHRLQLEQQRMRTPGR